MASRLPTLGLPLPDVGRNLARTNGGRERREDSSGRKRVEARYRGARVAFQVSLLFPDFTAPSMVSPFTRPEYSAPPTVKLI